MTQTRRVCRTAAAALVALALLGVPATALADPVPASTPELHESAPLAVRSNQAFVVRGTAWGGVVPGEPVAVVLERRSGGTWVAVATVSAATDAAGGFSATLSAPTRGRWRVIATVPATLGHAAGQSAPAPVRAVGHKVVALTFDDGPWRGSTDKIVRILKNADVQATFFMLGAQVKGQPLRAKSVADAGNQVAVHSWKHANMARRSSSKNAADLKRCIAVTKQATGVTPKWFRPPGGSTSSALRRTAASVGLRQVIWSTDTLDWRIRNKASITKRAVNGVRNGGVTLMHDGGGNRSATVAALPGIIATLRAKGYDFVTLDELVALGYKPK